MTVQKTSERRILLLPDVFIMTFSDSTPTPPGLGCGNPASCAQAPVLPVMLLRPSPCCCRVKDTYDSTKAKIREYAESVEPHNDMEAIKSSGGIPSNTADIVGPDSPFTCS